MTKVTSFDKIQGFIFDIDGTLLDSTPFHLSAWQSALKAFNIYHPDNHVLSLFGMPTSAIAKILLGDKDIHPATAETIASNKSKYFLDSIPQIPLYDGVPEILSTLHELGFKICFASANYNYLIERMMETYNWKPISVGFIGVNDVKHSKPDPEMLVLAMEKLGTKPENSVIVGDSEYDILAGKAAKVMTVAVCTKHDRKFFEELKTDIILDKIGDLLEMISGK